MSRSYWLSTTRMTVLVETDDYGIIRVAPPIVRKFIGQPINALVNWMREQPGFRGGWRPPGVT